MEAGMAVCIIPVTHEIEAGASEAPELFELLSKNLSQKRKLKYKLPISMCKDALCRHSGNVNQVLNELLFHTHSDSCNKNTSKYYVIGGKWRSRNSPQLLVSM